MPAQVRHEPVQAVVPVVVAGDGEDRAVEVAVGAEELRAVVAQLARRVDHVAADDREVDAVGLGEQRRHDGVLAVVALARVAEQQERDRRRRRRADDEVRVVARARPARSRAIAHPGDAGAVDRVVEVLGEHVVARRPQRLRAAARSSAWRRPGTSAFHAPGPPQSCQPAPADDSREEGCRDSTVNVAPGGLQGTGELLASHLEP